MSFDELRRDHKASEGDPLLRGRRRQRHRALIRGAVSARARRGLRRRQSHARRDRARICAAGTSAFRACSFARRTKGRAKSNGLRARIGVPIVENVALARALLATTEVGDFIPPDTYGAIATIVAMLLRSRR